MHAMVGAQAANYHVPYDPKKQCCGWCFGMWVPKKCPNCSRPYCSRECQTKDWKMSGGGHKFWCGKAGEKSVDYEVCKTEAKGFGMFAKRDFERGENILVERPVMTFRGGIYTNDALATPSVSEAAMALHPDDSNLFIKFRANCVDLSDDVVEDGGAGLFINFSRVNHDCIGNTLHYYDRKRGVEILVANHCIPSGSEITFSYVGTLQTRYRAFQLRIRGFKCSCRACESPEIAKTLDRMLELDEKIVDLASTGKELAAIRAGNTLIRLYDEFRCSDMLYARTYYDMFQAAIAMRQTVGQGVVFAQKAYQHALVFYGSEHDIVHKFKMCFENPSQHRNYLAAEW